MMNLFVRFQHHATLIFGAMLLCASMGIYADDLQDANKLFKQGKSNQALDKVNDILANNPKDAPARFLKGLILAEQAKPVAAIEIFTSLTEDHPELPEPYNNLAVLYARQGQFDKATQTLEKALRTNRSYATAYDNLGDLYAEMASRAYDRALQPERGNNTRQTKLAMIPEIPMGIPAITEPTSTSKPTPSKAESTTPIVLAATRPDPLKIEKLPESSTDNTESQTVSDTIMAWAAAWSSQDADKYLSFYSSDFKIPGGISRSAWEASRRERINTPKFIHVDIRIISTLLTNKNHAEVKFRQSYKASHMKSTNTKSLLMTKTSGKWLIQEERSK